MLQGGGGFHLLSGTGILAISAPSYYEFDAPPALWDATVNNAYGWSVEARTWMTDFESTNPSYGGLRIWIHDNTYLSRLDLYPDKIQVSGNFSGVHLMDTMDGYHTYRLEGQGTDLDVYVDGTPVLSLAAGPGGGTPTLFFGDGGGDNPTRSYWDYVTFTTVPEPATLSLLLAGSGLALIRRRRRT